MCAINLPEVRGKLEESGFNVVANTPEQFAAQHQRTFETYARAIKATGVEPK